MIVAGIPTSLTSNFKLGSTQVDALCILKENCQPLSKYNSNVFLLFALKSKEIILVGKLAVLSL